LKTILRHEVALVVAPLQFIFDFARFDTTLGTGGGDAPVSAAAAEGNAIFFKDAGAPWAFAHQLAHRGRNIHTRACTTDVKLS
jgi:hypothetical protein